MQPDIQSVEDNQPEPSLQQIKQVQGVQGQKLSKKQIKKALKKQKWQKEKLVKRKQKRQKQKLKKKVKKQQKAQQQNKQTALLQNINEQKIVKKRKDDYKQKMMNGLKVVIDLQFYHLMTQKQINSLIKQLSYCHSVNRRNQKCFNYILTSATHDRQQLFTQRYNADKWGIQMHQQNLLQIFPLQKIVYLTGDAQQEIQQFDPELIYVIGGIVDHNRLKKITWNFALQNKVKAMRLPMKAVHLKASVHLAVNHVWQWMLKCYNGQGWDEALKNVIPMRKLQQQQE